MEKADSLSHPLYEKLREKIDEFNRTDQSDFDARNRLEREKTWLEWEIRKINRKGIDDYNLFILDKALKKEHPPEKRKNTAACGLNMPRLRMLKNVGGCKKEFIRPGNR